MRAIRLDDFDDPIVRLALLRYGRTAALPEADELTQPIIRDALAALRAPLANADRIIAEIGAAIDAALAAPAPPPKS